MRNIVKNSGFVKVKREICDSELVENIGCLGLFVLLALNSNWTSNDELKKGELYVSISDLAKRCRLSRTTVNRYIDKLESFGIVQRVRDGKQNRIKILRYIDYEKVYKKTDNDPF